MYLLRPSDIKKRFNSVILCFIFDPLYEILNYTNRLNNSAEKADYLKQATIQWIERRREYLYMAPRVASLISSSSLKPSYIKEHDLELIPQIISLPSPILEKFIQDTSDTFYLIVDDLKRSDTNDAIKLVKEEISKRYVDSDIHISPILCRLIASECIKLIWVGERLGFDLSNSNEIRELMDLYSIFVSIINRVNFTIGMTEVLQMIIDMISSFNTISPRQSETSRQQIAEIAEIEEMKKKLKEHLNDSLSTASFRIIEFAKNYEKPFPKITEFINEYMNTHEIIKPVFTEISRIFPYPSV